MTKNSKELQVIVDEALKPIVNDIAEIRKALDKVLKIEKKHGKENAETKPSKRGINGYNLFSAEMRPKLKEQGIDTKDMFKEIGKLWKELDENEKSKYNGMATKQKEENSGEHQEADVKQVADEPEISVNDDDDDVTKPVKRVVKKSDQKKTEVEEKKSSKKKIIKKNDEDDEVKQEKPIVKKSPVKKTSKKEAPKFNPEDDD